MNLGGVKTGIKYIIYNRIYTDLFFIAANFWIFFLMPVPALVIISEEIFTDFFIASVHRTLTAYGPNFGLLYYETHVNKVNFSLTF